MIMRDDGRPREPLVRAVLFPLGRVVVTQGVAAAIPPSEVLHALRRHARGDWGDVNPEDVGLNDRALKDGDRLLSVYKSEIGITFWIITEWDRSATTAL